MVSNQQRKIRGVTAKELVEDIEIKQFLEKTVTKYTTPYK